MAAITSRAGRVVNRYIKAGIAQVLRQSGVEFGVEAEIEAGDRRGIEGPDAAITGDDHVGKQMMRMQRRITRRRLVVIEVHHLTVANIHHDPTRRMVGELQPADVTPNAAALAALPKTHLADMFLERRHTTSGKSGRRPVYPL